MIVRTYGRRSRGLTRSYSDVVSEPPSQDVFNFTYSSQDSAHCHLSDPYSLDSPQELPISPPADLWKRKRAKVSDSEPCVLISSRESEDYAVVEISDGESEEPELVKKIDRDCLDNDSSQEVREFEGLPRRGSVENGVSGFSENGGSWKPKWNDAHGLNSSLGLHELEIMGSRVGLGSSRVVSRNHKEENGALKKKKKKKNKKSKKKLEVEEVGLGDLFVTSTLMETQESGETDELLEEVEYALDGLKKGQSVKVWRGSLLSLLSACGTAQQRRILRVHGSTKEIVDAVSGLNFDDPPSNLAAAALLCLLTTDGQGDHLLESPSCICFLIKLLKPQESGGGATKKKVPTIGSRLLGLCRKSGLIQDSAKGTDSSSTDIMLKVQDILVSLKEMKPKDAADHRMEEPKLTPKWISLLTMEKASLSTISIQDTSGTVRKMGGNFKDKLRELGGLDEVFEVARNCHSTMEEWLEKSPIFALDSKDKLGPDSLVVLLKCLKIMENTTIRSKDNQCHLLGMKGKSDGQRAPHFFTELILSIIKILSGVTIQRRSSRTLNDEKMGGTSEEDINSGGCCNMAGSQKSSSASPPCNQWQSGSRTSQESSQASVDPLLLKMRVESSSAVSCSGSYGNSDRLLEQSNDQDPFAFDGGDEATNWELLSGTGRMRKSLAQDNRGSARENEEIHPSGLMCSQQESSNMEIYNPEDASCSFASEEEEDLIDLLDTAVKVLVNLSNDNPKGCQHIAKLGGLEILSSLIAGHFPSFSNTLLTDQEYNLLVNILCLLVNMVEKDGQNRSRLASVTVPLPSISGSETEDERDVISLLCSIFVANHGAGQAAGEDEWLSLEDEESVLQEVKEAEKRAVEAYSALLLAFLSTESKSIRRAIAECLPNQKLSAVVPVLERFVEFHRAMNMISPETYIAVLEVIESCRIP
ncbi:wings apart-like protein 2 [Salvia hispanica]|uniref:wings apart-like protein 2 n=1 Tax=Salvia hispanica TaxID=49212 RepID=UPI002008F97F|nr:wings apart-like protein 2 [Salvia hispanica]